MRTETIFTDCPAPLEPFGLTGHQAHTYLICEGPGCDHAFDWDETVYRLDETDYCEDCFREYLLGSLRNSVWRMGGDCGSADYFACLAGLAEDEKTSSTRTRL